MGAHSRRKGASGEREICSFLRSVGWPDAERMVRTGTKNAQRETADPGDCRPGGRLVLEIKRHADRLTMGAVISYLTKVRRSAGAGELGVLVERQPGIPAARGDEWITWWNLADLLSEMHAAPCVDPQSAVFDVRASVRPVAVRMGDAVDLWIAAGRCPTKAPADRPAGSLAAVAPPPQVLTRPPRPAGSDDPFELIPTDGDPWLTQGHLSDVPGWSDVGVLVDGPGSIVTGGLANGAVHQDPLRAIPLTTDARLLMPGREALVRLDPFASAGAVVEAPSSTED